MKTNLNFQIATTVLALALGACSPKYYVPNTQNVPVIHEAGQTNLTLAGNTNQVEFQGAYGITNSLAVQASGGLVIPQEEDNGDGGRGRLVEAGLGYYKNILPGLLFDTYFLIGTGYVKNDFPSTVVNNPSTTGKISANIVRFGIQPSLSYHIANFSVSGSARVVSLNYSNIEGDLIFDNANQVDYLADNKSNFLIEPALTLRAGLEKVKLQLQIIRSFNLSNKDFRQDEGVVTLGLNFDFN